MLGICDFKHEPVCYDTPGCPVCEMREELESKIDDLQQEIKRLESEAKT
jgi:hypothetical protein